ncbi:uncharacterized protein LOC128964363 [Oppia nitens]|uniref:uncharacterized protein LOC128964363 n=1 Tax=Oppia nitens TaxID=1686743 RepID=UPI0023DC7559|nr:uncharacterized protein LOC128964363 [Oppia nitens]
MFINGFQYNLFESLTPDDYSVANRSQIYQRVGHINHTIDRFNRMSGFAKNVSKIYEPIVNRLTARFSELLMEIDLPNDCMSSLIKLGSAVKDKKKWALNFLRTFPTPKSGLIQGSTSPIGYDECLSIESTNDMSGQSIRGQYCWVAKQRNKFY